jgi:hypothetical protein
MNEDNLINELKSEGASAKEADELALFSKNINNLMKFERSSDIKLKFLKNTTGSRNRFSRRYAFATLFSLLLLLGFSSVVGAQKSLPGDKLYPVKIASENIASFIDPSFKNEIIKRRSEEIKDLSSTNNSKEFHQTVETYEKELNENNKIDILDIRESRRNLEEAREDSLEENKEDLDKVINRTRSIQEDLENEEVKGEHTGPGGNKDEDEEKSGEDNKTQNPTDNISF